MAKRHSLNEVERQPARRPKPVVRQTIQPEPEKQKQKKRKKPKKEKKKMKLWKKIVIGLVITGICAGGGYWGYYNYIKYPPLAKQDVENSPLGAIKRFNQYLQARDWESLDKEIKQQSYLSWETEYANGDEDILKFMDNVIGTLSIETKQVKGLDIYGNPKIDPKTEEYVYVDSLLDKKGDTATVNHIDYNAINFDTKEIQAYLKANNLKLGDPDYTNKVIPIFCRYMNNLNWRDIPLTTTDHAPITKGNKLTVEEEAYYDDLLFASEDFLKLLDRFDKAVNNGKEPVTEAWEKWNKLKDKDKKKTEEPVKMNQELMIGRRWCGAHYLQTGYKNEKGELEVIMPQRGDGTLEKPATINTSILTYVLSKDKKGKEIATPIRVELVKLLTGDECLKDLADHDSRNRGLDESSQTRYASLAFKVTNLSKNKLTIKDNSSLADQSGNLSGRTGTVYGLTTSATLNKGESAIIESWVSSTELDRKYLIWGADFNKKSPNIYFGVFKGEYEDEKAIKNTNNSDKDKNKDDKTV